MRDGPIGYGLDRARGGPASNLLVMAAVSCSW
jgi:hypothetical protein